MSVTIYILLLEGDNIYVGRTTNMTKRYQEHLSGKGSAWTQKHKLIRKLEEYPNSDVFDEDKYVKKYMHLYGINKVRGGSYSEVILDADKIAAIENEFRGALDQCMKCGKKGHFIKNCPNNEKSCNRNNHDTSQCYANTDGSPIIQLIKCTICSKEYKTENGFEKHQLKCGKKETLGVQQSVLTCLGCSKTYTTVRWFNEHLSKCILYKNLVINEKSFPKDELKQKFNVTKNQKSFTEEMDFYNPKSSIVPLKNNIKETIFKCRKCGKKLKQGTSITEPCEECKRKESSCSIS